MKNPLSPVEVRTYYSIRVPKLKGGNKERRGPCPIHTGKDDNFAVNAETGEWFCHSQCGQGGSVVDLEMRLAGTDFTTAVRAVERLVGRIEAKRSRIVATYDYRNADGELVHQVVRFEPKGFKQRRPDGQGGWIWDLVGVTRVPYRLSRLKDADTVLIVEGEKDVHNIENLGLVATCNAEGAKKWKPHLAEYLVGKSVAIFPDNDTPGQEHARMVAHSLVGKARDVRIVNVPVGKDVSDWIRAGANEEVIQAAIDAAPLWRADMSTADALDSERATPKQEDDEQDTHAKLPAIILTNRHLRDVTAETIRAIQSRNMPPRYFSRAGALVDIRGEGRLFINVLDDYQTRGIMGRCASFFRLSMQGKTPTTPALSIAKDILALPNLFEAFPRLEAIIGSPVLRPDGSVLNQPGYDAATKLVYAPDARLVVPPIPHHPTREQIEGAVQTIASVFCDFPFIADLDIQKRYIPQRLRGEANAVYPASLANTFAAILTTFVRPLITGPTPLALVDAVWPGTGKTLFCELIAIIATGEPAGLFSAPHDEDEFRKQITSQLLDGHGVIVFDNIREPLESGEVCKLLTAMIWSDRILGKSKTVRIPVRSLFMATGNQLKVQGDLPRRCYWICMDAGPHPEQRTGFRHPKVRTYVDENRGLLVGACLTLARAWIAAGKPAGVGITFGGYESWTEVMSGILDHAGIVGFLGNRQADEVDEQQRNNGCDFIKKLESVLGPGRFTSAMVDGAIRKDPKQIHGFLSTLPEHIGGVFADQELFIRRLGRWFRQISGRWLDERRTQITADGQQHGVMLWRIVNPDASPEQGSFIQ